MSRLTWRAACVVVAGMLAATLQACGGVDIEQAKQLANAGVAASDRMHIEARQTATRMASWREGRVFFAVLVDGNRDLVMKSDGSDIAQLAKLLKKRADAIGALSSAYKSFQELAVYDAAGNTQAAAAAFFAQTNEFLKTAQELPGDAGSLAKGISPLDPQVTEGLSLAFGVIAREVQRAKLAKASVALRTGVEKLAEVLKAERIYAVSIRQSIADDRHALRTMARRRGIGSYEQPTKELLSEFDIVAVKDLDPAVLRSPQAKAAVERILNDRYDAERATIGPTYDALLKLLDSMVEQHKQLEAGRRISLASIIALASELEGYYQRVHGASAKSGS
ncbi:MAG: hypothetical protein KIT25_03850 [Enhydrobacter sp.]|nr:MAG: hypothetical protein KIT25_03850 [Enhydrobacter sp.]